MINSIYYIYAIAFFIVLGFLSGFIFLRGREKKFEKAAGEFRDRILNGLEGLYPIPRRLDADVFHRFSDSIPWMESAAAGFRPFIPSGRRNEFDTAVKNYCDHCRQITWQDCVTFKIVPGSRKPDDIGPKEIFRQNVNALLSFTKKI